ncbi:MAG: pitrilysin family protein [Patescibacteria group bacterium]|jgi:predicted Zn-dependent peptidase
MSRIRNFRLDNGAQVLIAPDERAIDVGLAIALRAGSADELTKLYGATHLLEHLMGHNLGKHQMLTQTSQEIDRLTTGSNASTDRHVTIFHFETTAGNFSDLIELAYQMIVHPHIFRPMVDTAIGQVAEDINRTDSEPDRLVADRIMSDFHLGEEVRHSIFGTVEGLGRISIPALRQYHRQIVCGQRMVIVVTGKIRVGTAERIIRKQFGNLPAGQAVLPISFRPSLRRRLTCLPNHDLPTVFYGVSFPLPFTPWDKHSLPYHYISKRLVGLDSSSLTLRVVKELGTSYSFAGDVWDFPDGSRFLITSTAEPKNLLQHIFLIFLELAELGNGSLKPGNLDMITRHLRHEIDKQALSPMDQANEFAEQLVTNGRITTSSSFARSASMINVEKVRRRVRTRLQPTQSQVSMVGPVDRTLLQRVRRLISSQN